MTRHRKEYCRTGTGVNLTCEGLVVAESSFRLANFSVSQCVRCRAEVMTTGHSPETDKVFEVGVN